MRVLPLLGKPLKSDEIMEVLEIHEMNVVYDFDRLHENIPDRYVVNSKEGGFELQFDERQVLDVIFLHIKPEHGFAPFALSLSDIPICGTIEDVSRLGTDLGVSTTSGEGKLFGISRKWTRLEFPKYSVHYEFREELAMVTVQARKPVE